MNYDKNVVELYLEMARVLVRQANVYQNINFEYYSAALYQLKKEGLIAIKKEELEEMRLNSARVLSISEELDTIVSKVLLINSSDNSISEETEGHKK